jgi:hypothetical protein
MKRFPPAAISDTSSKTNSGSGGSLAKRIRLDENIITSDVPRLQDRIDGPFPSRSAIAFPPVTWSTSVSSSQSSPLSVVRNAQYHETASFHSPSHVKGETPRNTEERARSSSATIRSETRLDSSAIHKTLRSQEPQSRGTQTVTRNTIPDTRVSHVLSCHSPHLDPNKMAHPDMVTPPIKLGSLNLSLENVEPGDTFTPLYKNTSASKPRDNGDSAVDSSAPAPASAISPLSSAISAQDLCYLYSITSTFPFTETSMIRFVYERLSGNTWIFSDGSDMAIAAFMKKCFPFYRSTSDNLLLYDPEVIHRRCSPGGDLAKLSSFSYDFDTVANRVLELTSALCPTDEMVHKAWRVAYSEFLFQREICGQGRYSTFSELQIARGVRPLTDMERKAHVEDLIEYVIEKVELKWAEVSTGQICDLKAKGKLRGNGDAASPSSGGG